MPHLCLVKYESCFIWQSVRNNLIVEWERPSVSESHLIHVNFGKLSHALPLFPAKSNTSFLRLLPVQLETRCLDSKLWCKAAQLQW